MLQVLFIWDDKDLDSRMAGTEPPTKDFVSTGYTAIGALLEATAIVLMTALCVWSHLNFKPLNLKNKVTLDLNGWKRPGMPQPCLWHQFVFTHLRHWHISALSEIKYRQQHSCFKNSMKLSCSQFERLQRNQTVCWEATKILQTLIKSDKLFMLHWGWSNTSEVSWSSDLRCVRATCSSGSSSSS